MNPRGHCAYIYCAFIVLYSQYKFVVQVERRNSFSNQFHFYDSLHIIVEFSCLEVKKCIYTYINVNNNKYYHYVASKIGGDVSTCTKEIYLMQSDRF